jgi:hypothetical protein
MRVSKYTHVCLLVEDGDDKILFDHGKTSFADARLRLSFLSAHGLRLRRTRAATTRRRERAGAARLARAAHARSHGRARLALPRVRPRAARGRRLGDGEPRLVGRYDDAQAGVPTPAPFTTDWDAARRSIEFPSGLDASAVGAGHGIPMTGLRVAEEFRAFAAGFRPQCKSRYVREPARRRDRRRPCTTRCRRSWRVWASRSWPVGSSRPPSGAAWLDAKGELERAVQRRPQLPTIPAAVLPALLQDLPMSL